MWLDLYHMPIRLVIYEDNRDLRETLLLVLGSDPELEVLAAFENCVDVQHHMSVYRPDVVLMDIDMPEVNGIEGTTIIKTHFPEIQVLMLTVFEEADHIFDAICAGANGYLLKKTSPDQLLKAIHDVISGGAPMTPLVAKKVIERFPKRPPPHVSEAYQLSPRETEILNCLIKGLSYKLVASQLDISIDTVRSHIKKIYEKLHVNSATEAVSKALQFRGNS